MAKEKYDAEKATLLANKDYANRLQGTLSGEYAYDGELTKSMSDAYTSTLAKTGNEDKAKAAMSIVEAEGKKAILNDPVRLKNIASSVGYSGGDNIDIKDQILLKTNLFAPLDKKEEQIIAERESKKRYALEERKLRQDAAQHAATLGARTLEISEAAKKTAKIQEDTYKSLLPLVPVATAAEAKKNRAAGMDLSVIIAKMNSVVKDGIVKKKEDKEKFDELAPSVAAAKLKEKFLGKVNEDSLTNAIDLINSSKFRSEFYDKLTTIKDKQAVMAKFESMLTKESLNPWYWVPEYGDYEQSDYKEQIKHGDKTLNQLF